MGDIYHGDIELLVNLLELAAQLPFQLGIDHRQRFVEHDRIDVGSHEAAAERDLLLAVGRQAGGRVGFFLETADFDRDYARLRANGVEFVRPPRDEAYGRVVVFRDLYGNDWDLIGPVSAQN